MTLTKKAIKSFEAGITSAKAIRARAEKDGDTETVIKCNQEIVTYSMSLFYIGYDFYCDNYGAHVYKMEKEITEWKEFTIKKAVEIYRLYIYTFCFSSLMH